MTRPHVFMLLSALLGGAILVAPLAHAAPPAPTSAPTGKVTPPAPRPAGGGAPGSVKVTPPPPRAKAEFDLSIGDLKVVEARVSRGKLASVSLTAEIVNVGTRRYGFSSTARFALSEGLPSPQQRPVLRVSLDDAAAGIEPNAKAVVGADIQKTAVVRFDPVGKTVGRQLAAPLDLPLNRYYTVLVELAAREDTQTADNVAGVAFFVDANGKVSEVRPFVPDGAGNPRWTP